MPSISALFEDYSEGAQLLRNAVRSTAGSGLDARPIKGKWTVREVVCHLADSEIIYADRMKRVLAEDDPTFFEADPTIYFSQHFVVSNERWIQS